jgi:hypothetical protein
LVETNSTVVVEVTIGGANIRQDCDPLFEALAVTKIIVIWPLRVPPLPVPLSELAV